MATPKGYPTQEKDDRIEPQFSTVEPVRALQYGLSTIAHQFVFQVGTDAVEASSTTSVINATAHAAQHGDIIRFTSGSLSGREVKVDSVSANAITLSETLSAAPSATDAFEILRHRYPRMDSNGAIETTGAGGGSAPIEFRLDGADQQVIEDTVTPANNRPLPVKLISANGDVTITADNLDVQLTHTGGSPDSIQIGDGTDLLAINGSGEAAVADATAQASLSSIDGKLVDGTDIGDVTINNASGAAAVNIQDGGNVISVDDGAGSLTIDNANLDAALSTLATEASLSTIAGTVSGSEVQVDVVAPLPAGSNLIGSVSIDYLDVVDFLDTPLLDTSSSNIPGSASTPLTVVASLAAGVSKIQVCSTVGEFVGLYSDPAGSPVLEAIFAPGSDQTVEVTLASTTVLGLRSMTASAISTGEMALNFMG